jgi:large subunit ribosomal protein L25
MAMVDMAAESRTETGKEANRRLAHAGKVPGVIYGKGSATRSLTFERRPLEKYLLAARRGTVIVKLAIAGDGGPSEAFAVLKEVQNHPVTDKVIHVDFFEVAAGKKFHIGVPVRIRGKAAGTEFGGILEVNVHELEVVCTPESVPESIDVDVTPLGLGQTIHLGDIVFPAGVSPVERNRSLAIVSVHSAKGEAAPAEAEAAAGGEAKG